VGIYFYLSVDKLFSVVGLILLLILQIVLLLNYLRKIDKELSGFFTSICEDDFQSANINSDILNRHSNLGKALKKLKDTFNNKSKEAEIQQLLLARFLEHVDTAIILFDEKGTILWLNTTALNILRIPRFYSINDLWKAYPGMKENFNYINPGERKIYKLNNGYDILALSLRKSEFKTKDNNLSLFAFDHINREYSDIEQESWEKLIKVITHEIMNTLTPVTALTESLKKDLSVANNSENYVKSTERSLNLIDERSKGLIKFVNRYRKVTTTPELNRTLINVAELLYNTRQLTVKDKENLINISIKPIDLELFADKELIAQVLINLIKNSIEAIEDKPNGKIDIEAYKEDNKTIIKIQDNGKGIDKELRDKIFIPFYSTKKQGSGIGLSLARQIMRLHGGNISVYSVVDEKTVFTLVF
jgi:nitrogen fixation/metabolism regulation signal transduction histidine kinase